MNTAIETLDSILEAAQAYDASDLLLHEGRVPQMRQAGRLVPLEVPALESGLFDELWRRCRAPKDALDFDSRTESPSGIRFRVNLMRQMGNRGAVLRRIRANVPDLASLGLPAALLKDWAERGSGFVLVTGPTGSGKSTTLAAMIEWMNQNFDRHIVTIEDPIEYLFTGNRCLFTQREVGIDTPSFAEGLRRSLRQNPDVIFIGEIRDSVAAATALQAAETGHLVLATLHASNAADAIERLQALFPADEREAALRTLSQQLIGILCQKLLPSLSGNLALALEYLSNQGGSRRLIAGAKIPEIADFITRSDSRFSRGFLDSLTELVKANVISEEEALLNVENASDLQRALRGVSSSSQVARR